MRKNTIVKMDYPGKAERGAAEYGPAAARRRDLVRAAHFRAFRWKALAAVFALGGGGAVIAHAHQSANSLPLDAARRLVAEATGAAYREAHLAPDEQEFKAMMRDWIRDARTRFASNKEANILFLNEAAYRLRSEALVERFRRQVLAEGPPLEGMDVRIVGGKAGIVGRKPPDAEPGELLWTFAWAEEQTFPDGRRVLVPVDAQILGHYQTGELTEKQLETARNLDRYWIDGYIMGQAGPAKEVR